MSLKGDVIIRLNMNLAMEEIKVRAKEGSRIILELACLRYSKANSKYLGTLTDSFVDFKKNVALSAG